MSGFLRELYVPGVVGVILAIVWSTAHLTDLERGRMYYPPDDPALFHRIARRSAQESDESPVLAGVENEP